MVRPNFYGVGLLGDYSNFRFFELLGLLLRSYICRFTALFHCQKSFLYTLMILNDNVEIDEYSSISTLSLN